MLHDLVTLARGRAPTGRRRNRARIPGQQHVRASVLVDASATRWFCEQKIAQKMQPNTFVANTNTHLFLRKKWHKCYGH
jgi:hypothetical protein